MSVPRQIQLSTRLISAFMLGVAVLLCPKAPFAAEGLTNEQLHRLFSGSVVHASGGACQTMSGGMEGQGKWDFDLKEDGRLEVIFTCVSSLLASSVTVPSSYPFEERSSGKWRIEANKLCMEDPDGLISRYTRGGRTYKCWRVKPGTSFFDVYESDFRKVWEFTVFNSKLPKGFHRQVAALDTLSGKATTESGTAAQKEIARLKREAAEARKELAAARARTAELKRKKEEEKLRALYIDLATLEKKKEDAGSRAAAELKRKKDEQARLAAKATTDKKRQGGKQSLRERVAALKDLKDAGLLSEEEFQARKKAVLDEFLGVSVAATTQPAANQDETLWASVKDSKNSEDIQKYLTRSPQGGHAKEAKAKLKVLKKFASISDIKFGNYYALVIGNNNYKNLPKLKTAVGDATAMAEVLEKNYGFRVKLMIDAGRLDIVDAFDELRETLTYKDNLLIYYAGHGWLDEDTGQGYWMPVDAKPNRRSRWVSNATLKDTLKSLSAKHVMVVADSCFSGTLIRGASIGIKSADYWRKMADKQTRVAMTSGGLEPVADADGKSKHSPFASAFIKVLRDNDVVIDGTTLFNNIRRPVMLSAQQTPAYSDVRGAGHEGGDFLFVRKK